MSLGEGGLVKVKNIDTKGKIVVWYNGTAIQKVSYAISFITLIFIIVMYFYKYKKTK